MLHLRVKLNYISLSSFHHIQSLTKAFHFLYLVIMSFFVIKSDNAYQSLLLFTVFMSIYYT